MSQLALSGRFGLTLGEIIGAARLTFGDPWLTLVERAQDHRRRLTLCETECGKSQTGGPLVSASRDTYPTVAGWISLARR